MVSECFFLGSGFSKAMYNYMPTIHELSDEVNKRVVNTTENWAKEYFQKIPTSIKTGLHRFLCMISRSHGS